MKRSLHLLPSFALGLTCIANASAADVFSLHPSLNEIPVGTALHQSISVLNAVAQEEALRQLSEIPKADVSSLHASTDGSLCYSCQRIAPQPAGRVGKRAVTVKAAVPISSPPKRHSKPGAPAVLFIDFNGATITGTQWNTDYKIDSWKARPYSADADFTTFSDQEQDDIIRIWEMVAEDFAPFNIDVTTEEPSSKGAKTGWALVTDYKDADGKNTPMVFPGGIAGGVAYLNKFGATDFQKFTPAWVLDYHDSDLSLVEYTADTVSHEFGHNLGLNHDGNSREEYEGGFPASGVANSWAPIMGGGLTVAISQWSKGEYQDSSNKQDDLAIISKLLPYVKDDHGGANSPTGLVLSNKAFTAKGVITQTSEIDAFKVSLGAGQCTVTATPFYTAGSTTDGGNLDIKLTLTTLSGTVVATANSTPGTDASIDTTVTAGTHLILVEPSGAGTPNAGSGYAVYGSLGQYTLRGTGEPGSTNNNSGSDGTDGSGTTNNNLGSGGNDLPGPTYDGAEQGDNGGGCGLGTGLGTVLAGSMLLGFRLRRTRR